MQALRSASREIVSVYFRHWPRNACAGHPVCPRRARSSITDCALANSARPHYTRPRRGQASRLTIELRPSVVLVIHGPADRQLSVSNATKQTVDRLSPKRQVERPANRNLSASRSQDCVASIERNSANLPVNPHTPARGHVTMPDCRTMTPCLTIAWTTQSPKGRSWSNQTVYCLTAPGRGGESEIGTC